MPSLNDYATLLERLQSSNLRVETRKCTVVRNRNVSCRRCARACTSGCISLQGNSLVIDPEKCIGCGTCATACPTGALSPRHPDDREVAHAAVAAVRATGGIAVFACADVVQAAGARLDPDTVVGVPCIGHIDESMAAVLVSAGAREVRVVAGNCDECPYKSGRTVAEDVCANVNTLLQTWGSSGRMRITRTFPKECRKTERSAVYDPARREFLLTMKSEAQGLAADALDVSIDRFFDDGTPHPLFQHVTQDGTLPHFLPPRRQLLLDALDALGRPADELIATRLWGHVIIDAAKCRECRMCAVFCPTGALSKLLVHGHDKGLVHAPGICVKCRSCEEVCPQGALRLSEEVFAVDLHAGIVEQKKMAGVTADKGGPDAIRNSMSKLIDSPYVWG